MRILIIGSGPTGLILGHALGSRGHEVLSVDRDPGPTAAGWRRKGVMQFEHAHNFRQQVPQLLRAEWPRAHDEWLALGAEPIATSPGAAGPPMRGMLSRRSTFELALRRAAATSNLLELHTGHVDRLLVESGRVRGAVVDGTSTTADLVVDASGRAGRVSGVGTRARSADHLEGDCGLAYIDRTYRLREGSPRGPVNSPLGFLGQLEGYQCLLFVHEKDHFSVVLIRPTADAALKALRFEPAFRAACTAIPALAEWTDPARSFPTSGVLVGGALRNVYRRQAGVPGLVTVGDAVATTTPTRGRGVAMASLQIEALLRLVDEGEDPVTVADPFGAWCEANIEPWVADHIAIDGGTVRRWQGEDLDLGQPLTSDLIADAVVAEPRIGPYAAGYFTMTALPASLQPAEPLARRVYESGWRPPFEAGPTRDELVEVIERATNRTAA